MLYDDLQTRIVS